MKYAVVVSGGKQYKVKEGDTVKVDSLNLKPNDKHKFDKVLLVVNEEARKIGTPYIEKAEVLGQVTGQGKGDKVRVAKFKAKARYRKVIGFRPVQTTLKISSITLGK